MQPDKKQLEIILMQYFRESYSDFPRGILKPNESPDFTINMKNHHVLGIELTRLNPVNAEQIDENGLQEIRFREHFITFARELFEQGSSKKLFVKFLFSEENNITAEREMLVAVQTVNAIRKAINNRNTDHFFKESLTQSKLPEGLDEILIINHPVLDASIWERANNLGISNDVVYDIRKSIHKKDEKLRIYQKQHLNYYWLLITTDRLRGVRNFNLAEKVINHKFQSRFQKVFLFDLIKSDMFQLV